MKLYQIMTRAAVACLLLAGAAQAQSQGPDIVVHQLGVDGSNTNNIQRCMPT